MNQVRNPLKKVVSWVIENEDALFLLFIMGMVIFIMFAIVRSNNEEEKRGIRADAYLRDHKCVTAGFAGANAAPVYQCDNGLIMRKQIP